MLADEPTGNLDSKTNDAIVALPEELKDQGTTIVVITTTKSNSISQDPLVFATVG